MYQTMMIHKPVDVEDVPGRDVLFSITNIDKRVRGMAQQINQDYAQKDLVVISVLASGLVFTADLIRAIKRPLEIGFMRATSYNKGGNKTEVLVEDFLPDRVEVGNRDVLIVDGICESGRSLLEVAKLLDAKSVKPKSIRTCIFAMKRMGTPVIQIDYHGITIPECLVYGYGINHMGKFRHEPNLKRLWSENAFPELASGLDDTSCPEANGGLILDPTRPTPDLPQSNVEQFDRLLAQVQDEWIRLKSDLRHTSPSNQGAKPR
jgi:hypoxanthine phosphoribosyltransferase